MPWQKKYIGFNDGILMLIGIPLLSFIIPIVFMGCRFNRLPYFTWDKFFAAMVITTVIWVGNRFIMVYSRKKYPLFENVRKRIIFQSGLMVLFTLAANISLGQALNKVFDKEAILSVEDKLIHSNSAALFCTIMVIAVYESIFFMTQLKQTVQEKEKLKRETLNAQLNALRTQVNPHFLFNNLNTLSSLIPENQNHAVSFVQQLSKVYRHILDVKDEKSIPLREELDVLEAYYFLLQTRFGDNIKMKIDIPCKKLDKKVVPLSLQLLLENAIKHNIVSAAKPLHIELHCENGSLTMQNNLQPKNQVSETGGLGLNNIINRYKLLGNHPVTVMNTDTTFTVTIPLIEN